MDTHSGPEQDFNWGQTEFHPDSTFFADVVCLCQTVLKTPTVRIANTAPQYDISSFVPMLLKSDLPS